MLLRERYNPALLSQNKIYQSRSYTSFQNNVSIENSTYLQLKTSLERLGLRSLQKNSVMVLLVGSHLHRICSYIIVNKQLNLKLGDIAYRSENLRHQPPLRYITA